MKKKEQYIKIKNISVSKVLFDFINSELLRGLHIKKKFYRLVKDALPSTQAKDLVSEIMGIESSTSLKDALRLLVVKDN